MGSTQKWVARWSQTPAFIGSLQGFAGLAREQEFVTKAANFLYFIFDKSNVNLYNDSDTLRFTTEWKKRKKKKFCDAALYRNSGVYYL